MISKELLNEVLKINIDENDICLAHKCKEWAFKNGFEIVVFAYWINI